MPEEVAATQSAAELVVEPEHSDPWLRRFGPPAMSWCVVRDVEPPSANGEPAGGEPRDGELETVIHAWLTRAREGDAEWVARISGPYHDVVRSTDRLFHGEGRSAAVAMAVDEAPASVTLAAVVEPRDVHLLVRRAWRHGLTLALLRVRGASGAEVVAAFDRGDDGQALGWSDRVAVCHAGVQRCCLGASDPAALPGPLTSRPAYSLVPVVEQADHHRRLRWPGPKSAIPLGAAIVAVAAALVILLSGVLRPAPQSRAGVLGGSPAASSAPLVVPAPSSPTPVESPSSAPAATVPPDVQLASAPPQRTGEAVAFDGANAAVVLFGGVSGSTTLADTWLFSGGAWTQAHPRTSPPPRTGAAMAYNPATGHVVLVGGTSGSGARLDDTWIWDGTTWSAVAVRTRPTGIPIALAFDSDRGTLVLLTRASGTAAAARTWTFAAGTWSERPSAAATAASQGAAMVDDPSLGRLVLVDVAGTATRTWDGRAWSDVPGAATPSGASANIAFDPAGRELVLVVSAPGQPPSTWVFDGTAWRARATELGPATVAALTSTTTQVLAFGGPTAADDLSQAWRWSSASWGG